MSHPEILAQMSDDNVRRIFEDRQNTLLFASAGNGVYKVLPGAFNHYKHPTIELNINTVFEDSQKELWIGTECNS